MDTRSVRRSQESARRFHEAGGPSREDRAKRLGRSHAGRRVESPCHTKGPRRRRTLTLENRLSSAGKVQAPCHLSRTWRVAARAAERVRDLRGQHLGGPHRTILPRAGPWTRQVRLALPSSGLWRPGVQSPLPDHWESLRDTPGLARDRAGSSRARLTGPCTVPHPAAHGHTDHTICAWTRGRGRLSSLRRRTD